LFATLVKIALQLYTVRDQMARDWKKTLERVAAAGYRAVEFAGNPFMSAPAGELKKFLETIGLKPVSAHVSYRDLRSSPDRVLSYAAELGLSFIVAEPDFRWVASEKDAAKLAEEMSEVGREVSKRGMRYAMHNHAIQFERLVGGRPVYWLIAELTDPRYVYFQPDVYWIKYAGYDPIEVIERLRGRCPLAHLKDMKDERTREMAEVGEGIIDFAKIVGAGSKAGVEWYVIEHDDPPGDSVESARKMLSYLRSRFGEDP